MVEVRVESISRTARHPHFPQLAFWIIFHFSAPCPLVFSPIGRQCFSLVPEIQYCLFYFTVLKDLFYFNFKFSLFYFSFVVLVVLLCCIILIIITYWEFPEFHSTFKKMRVGAQIIMSQVPRLSCKSRLCFKKGALKISSYKPAHVNTAGAQSTVLVWSYTLAAVPILGSAPSDVSLLWAA